MAGIYKDDAWSVAEGKMNGLPLVIRARSRLPSVPDRAIYQNLVLISWPYDADASGMPSADSARAMEQFGDAIEAALENKGVAVEAASITGNGMKEWRYYTYDKDELMSALNAGLADHPLYPINIKLFADPEWSALSELLPSA